MVGGTIILRFCTVALFMWWWRELWGFGNYVYIGYYYNFDYFIYILLSELLYEYVCMEYKIIIIFMIIMFLFLILLHFTSIFLYFISIAMLKLVFSVVYLKVRSFFGAPNKNFPIKYPIIDGNIRPNKIICHQYILTPYFTSSHSEWSILMYLPLICPWFGSWKIVKL